MTVFFTFTAFLFLFIYKLTIYVRLFPFYQRFSLQFQYHTANISHLYVIQNILNFHIYILTFSHCLSDCLVVCLYMIRNFVYSACILATYPHFSHCYRCFVNIPPILTNLTVTCLLLCQTKQSTFHTFLRIYLPQSLALAITFMVCCCIHLLTYLTCNQQSLVKARFNLLILFLHFVITLRIHTKLNILTCLPFALRLYQSVCLSLNYLLSVVFTYIFVH